MSDNIFILFKLKETIKDYEYYVFKKLKILHNLKRILINMKKLIII